MKILEGKSIGNVVCWFLGLGSLFSWNSMLTVADYYYQLFPDYHPSRVLPLVYQPFSLGTITMFAYYQAKVNTRKRTLCGYTLAFLGNLGLLLIDLGTGGKGGIGNYVGICVVMAAFGIANSTIEGGMIGDISYMCPEFMQSFSAGLAASGALTSALRLVTKAAFDKTENGLRKGAVLFLSISTIIELLCVFLYEFMFGRLAIVKNFRNRASTQGLRTVEADSEAAGIETAPVEHDRLSTRVLLIQNIDYALDLWLTYVLTLFIFPGFLYENTGAHRLGSWYAVVLIAVYNMLDLIGRYIPLIKSIKLESRRYLLVASLLRFVFIPLFYFTAKYGDQGWMIGLVSLLGASNGYLTVCVLTVAPRGYNAPEQNALGNLLVLFLIAGVFSGVVLDWLWLIGHK